MARWVDDGDVSREIADDVRGLLAHLAEDVAQDARRLAPVRTGHLRSSIHAETGGDTVTVQADADYSAFPEMGTRFMRAEPYLRPALYRTRGGAA